MRICRVVRSSLRLQSWSEKHWPTQCRAMESMWQCLKFSPDMNSTSLSSLIDLYLNNPSWLPNWLPTSWLRVFNTIYCFLRNIQIFMKISLNFSHGLCWATWGGKGLKNALPCPSLKEVKTIAQNREESWKQELMQEEWGFVVCSLWLARPDFR